jgi:hypothetical protein
MLPMGRNYPVSGLVDICKPRVANGAGRAIPMFVATLPKSRLIEE